MDDEIWNRVYSPLDGRAMHYRLVGQTPVPCSLKEWAERDRVESPLVRLTRVGPFRVSTVFMGLDMNWGHRGQPILFETLTFLDDEDKLGDFGGMNEEDGRTSTWIEAECQHQRAVDYLRSAFCAPGEEPVEITE